MRFEGVLTAWNHDAGFGAIRPFGGGEEVFVALAAFPTDGDGPRPDESLSFEIVTGRDGRKHAVNVQRLPQARLSPAMRDAVGVGSARVRARRAQRKRRLAFMAAGAVVTVMLVVGVVRGRHPAGKTEEPPASMRR